MKSVVWGWGRKEGGAHIGDASCLYDCARIITRDVTDHSAAREADATYLCTRSAPAVQQYIVPRPFNNPIQISIKLGCSDS